jgi:predicted amidohydrolase
MHDLRVSTIQSSLHWEDEQANLTMFEQQLAELANQTDIIVLPEMFNSGFSMEPNGIAQTMQGNTVSWMQSQAKKLDAAICGSVAIKEGNAYVNRFIFAKPDGDIECYDKRHCFRMSGEHLVYRSGEHRLIIEYKGWRILPQICYDLRFPVFSRNQQDYDMVIYVANWPKVRRNPWRTLLQARAIENLAYCIGVNRVGFDGNDIEYSGDSLSIDFKGDVTFDHQDRVGVATHSLSLSALQQFKEKFPAWKDSDEFELPTS